MTYKITTMNNKILYTIDGVTRCKTEWLALYHRSHKNVSALMSGGMTFEDALKFKPISGAEVLMAHRCDRAKHKSDLEDLPKLTYKQVCDICVNCKQEKCFGECDKIFRAEKRLDIKDFNKNPHRYSKRNLYTIRGVKYTISELLDKLEHICTEDELRNEAVERGMWYAVRKFEIILKQKKKLDAEIDGMVEQMIKAVFA